MQFPSINLRLNNYADVCMGTLALRGPHGCLKTGTYYHKKKKRPWNLQTSKNYFAFYQVIYTIYAIFHWRRFIYKYYFLPVMEYYYKNAGGFFLKMSHFFLLQTWVCLNIKSEAFRQYYEKSLLKKIFWNEMVKELSSIPCLTLNTSLSHIT